MFNEQANRKYNLRKSTRFYIEQASEKIFAKMTPQNYHLAIECHRLKHDLNLHTHVNLSFEEVLTAYNDSVSLLEQIKKADS
ncbi:hypothetical protein ACFVWC_16410 [Bacillus mycoides]|uniref:hypothetical protein n=1 Tax=Bacillus mycoides TaxID=1405 RepID=UPI0036EFB924